MRSSLIPMKAERHIFSHTTTLHLCDAGAKMGINLSLAVHASEHSVMRKKSTPPRKSIEYADKQRITQAHRKALLYPIRGGQYAVRPNLFVLFFYAIWCMDCRNVLINESK